MRYTPSTDGLDPRIKKNLEDIARCIREFSANSSGIPQKPVSIAGGSSGSIRHGDTVGRAERDQHPIKSISGLEEELSRAHMKYAGMEYPAPEWFLNGSAPNITMPAGKCNLYDNENWQGTIQPYDIPAANFTLTNGADQIVIVDYNEGSPCYKLELGSPIPWNFSNKIGVCRFWWDGVTIHSEPTDSLGVGLPEKEATRTALTRFYERALDSGLAIGVTSTPAPHTATLTEGYMFAGSILEHLGPFNSSTDLFTRYVKNSGVWTPVSVTTFNSTSYNDNAGLVTASAGKYLVDWVYRSVGNIVQCFSVLGKTEFNNIADAKASPRRTDLPPVISKHCVLMGRYIVKVGASVGEVESVYTDVFSYGGITNHNDMSGIQDASGAVSGEHYHLNSAQADHVSKLEANWDMSSGTQQPVTDNAVDVGMGGATPKRVRSIFAYVVDVITDIKLAGLSLASIFAPISHASNGTTFGIASSTLYGHVKCSTTNPLMDGTASPGTDGALMSAYNHRHPTDTTREAVHTRTDITAATDFRTLDIGCYRVSGGTWHANNPGTGVYNWGVVWVDARGAAERIVIYKADVVPSSSSGGLWVDSAFGGTWRGWHQISSKQYLDTQYAALTGATFTGDVSITESTEGSYFFGRVSGENYARLSLATNAGGTGKSGFLFGNGTGAVDTNLYRNGANALKTDGAFAAKGNILSNADITAIGSVSGASLSSASIDGTGKVTFSGLQTITTAGVTALSYSAFHVVLAYTGSSTITLSLGSASSNAGRTIFVTCSCPYASSVILGSGSTDIIGNGFGATQNLILGTGAATLRRGYFVSSNGTHWVIIGT